MNGKQNVVMFSMSRYGNWMDGIVNRNYYLYRELLASDEVGTIVLVDLLPHSYRHVAKAFLSDIIGKPRGHVLFQRPWVRAQRIDEKTIHIASVHTPWSERAFLSFLTAFLKRHAIEDPILWSYLVTYVGTFSLPWKLKLFDAVDDWTAHPAYRTQRERLRRNYAEIGRHADLVVLVTESIGTLFQSTGASVVPNGVDTAPFADIRHERAVPPTISYVGTIQERFDVALMHALASARPQYRFELIGPVWKEVDVAKLVALPNVRLLGRRPYKELPVLLAKATAGIVPHRLDRLVASMNPMKIYDYLAAGLPVVTVPTKDFARFGDAVTSASSTDEFCAALDAVVARPKDKGAVRALVARETWRSRFEAIWALVDERLRKR